MKFGIDWRVFAVLLPACIVTNLLVLPYATSLSPIPGGLTPALVGAAAVQAAAEFTIAIVLGLYLAKKVGFGLPIIEDLVHGRKAGQALRSVLKTSVGLGLLAGILVVIFSVIYVPWPSLVQQSGASVPLWQDLLAIFYGGIGEETLFRLFVMTLLVWVSFKIRRTPDGRPTTVGVWVAIVLSAILFGLAHLPFGSTYVAVNPMTITEAIVNNGMVGVVSGWLYWKKGLESAMIGHFSSDVVLHLVVPIVLSVVA